MAPLLGAPPVPAGFPAADALIRDVAGQSEAALAGMEGHVLRTPLHRSVALEAGAGGDATRVYLKLESEQVTGSFKARGAAHKVRLCKERGSTSVSTASTGNHALATVHALHSFGMGGTIVLPTTAAPGKVDKIRTKIARGGASGDAAAPAAPHITLSTHGDECMQSEVEARRLAESSEGRVVFVSPYNDLEVVVGQSTIAVEVLQQLQGVVPDFVFVSVGGGGMISGIAAYLKRAAADAGREVTVVGCQPQNDAAMLECVKAGEVLEISCGDTLSDGTAGNVEPGSITLPYCSRLVDRWAVVSEGDIASAVKTTLDSEGKLIEGAAGVAVAGFLAASAEGLTKGKVSAIVVCGGNVSSDKALKLLGGV